MSFCLGTCLYSLLFHRFYGAISLIIRDEHEHGIQYMPSPFRVISEMLPQVHTMENCDFLKPIIYSQIIKLSVMSVI